MRSLLVAIVVSVVAVLFLARTVHAEPPPAMESRELKKVIAALQKEKGRRADLAALRFSAEVLQETTLEAPVGSSLVTLGAWGDNDALLDAERALAGCPAREPAQEKAASALLKEFGADLPVVLRAWTMGREGKKREAVALFVAEIQRVAPGDRCPSEHPMYSARRVSRIAGALQCVAAFDPARDTTALEELLEKARSCLKNNHAVG